MSANNNTQPQTHTQTQPIASSAAATTAAPPLRVCVTWRQLPSLPRAGNSFLPPVWLHSSNKTDNMKTQRNTDNCGNSNSESAAETSVNGCNSESDGVLLLGGADDNGPLLGGAFIYPLKNTTKNSNNSSNSNDSPTGSDCVLLWEVKPAVVSTVLSLSIPHSLPQSNDYKLQQIECEQQQRDCEQKQTKQSDYELEYWNSLIRRGGLTIRTANASSTIDREQQQQQQQQQQQATESQETVSASDKAAVAMGWFGCELGLSGPAYIEQSAATLTASALNKSNNSKSDKCVSPKSVDYTEGMLFWGGRSGVGPLTSLCLAHIIPQQATQSDREQSTDSGDCEQQCDSSDAADNAVVEVAIWRLGSAGARSAAASILLDMRSDCEQHEYPHEYALCTLGGVDNDGIARDILAPSTTYTASKCPDAESKCQPSKCTRKSSKGGLVQKWVKIMQKQAQDGSAPFENNTPNNNDTSSDSSASASKCSLSRVSSVSVSASASAMAEPTWEPCRRCGGPCGWVTVEATATATSTAATATVTAATNNTNSNATTGNTDASASAENASTASANVSSAAAVSAGEGAQEAVSMLSRLSPATARVSAAAVRAANNDWKTRLSSQNSQNTGCNNSNNSNSTSQSGANNAHLVFGGLTSPEDADNGGVPRTVLVWTAQ